MSRITRCVLRAVDKRMHEESGQSLILIALSMFALLGIVAVVIDGGNAYSQRRQVQIAADAAAIAGARQVALGASTAEVNSTIQTYTRNNGADSVQWNYLIRSGEVEGVSVQTSRTFETYFARLFGIFEMNTRAVADAQVSGLRRAGNLMPMGIEDFPFVIGETYVLWDNSLNVPGGFGWLSWNGNPSNVTLADNICNPSNSGFWEIGDWVPSGPGVQNSAPVRNCLNQWLGTHVSVIVYDTVQGQGVNASYRIHSFAEFRLSDYNFRGSPKTITGQFVWWVKPGEGGGPNRGLSTVNMTR